MCKKSNFIKRTSLSITTLRIVSQQSFLNAFIVRVKESALKIQFHGGIIIANHRII